MSVDRHRTLTTALTLSTALLASAAGDAWAIETCAQYNAQTRVSAEVLTRELQIANSPLRASELAEGRNPKLDAYLAQFAPDAQIHGLQGRPEPSNLNEVKAHYQHVMGSPGDPLDDPEGALREDLHVVAGPMAAHRYRASLQVPAFPPDFAYYDATLHGAGCDRPEAADAASRIGGAGSGRAAARALQRTLVERLGTGFSSTLLQPVSADTPYGELPISAWSFVAFQTLLDNPRAPGDTKDEEAPCASTRWCAQWILRLRVGAAPDAEPTAEVAWIDLREDAGSACALRADTQHLVD